MPNNTALFGSKGTFTAIISDFSLYFSLLWGQNRAETRSHGTAWPATQSIDWVQ